MMSPHKNNTNMTQHTMGRLMDLSLSTIMFFSILGTQKLVFWSSLSYKYKTFDMTTGEDLSAPATMATWTDGS